MLIVAEMVRRLSNFHWSPRAPEDYTLEVNGRTVGIGLIAKRNYAAFNLAWQLIGGRMDDYDTHRHAVNYFCVTHKEGDLDQYVGESELGMYITMMNAQDFLLWYQENRMHINHKGRVAIDAAYHLEHTADSDPPAPQPSPVDPGWPFPNPGPKVSDV